jgi:hexosaminidase
MIAKIILISLLSILQILSHCSTVNLEKELTIIPQPSNVEFNSGSFEINGDTRLLFFPEENEELKSIADWFSEFTHVQTQPGSNKNLDNTKNAIILVLEKAAMQVGSEGYSVEVKSNQIKIEAKEPAGIFYGLQTIRQLLPERIEKTNKKQINWKIPAVKILDEPRFIWRGLMLDCSRTFLAVDYIKKYIDLLAFYKMNVLHLHLTDDQGWRIEIKKHPQLTEICSKFHEKYPEEKGGFYSQRDMRDIIAYAKSRYITIVPEIEMPGHSSELFAAYPGLSCKSKRSEIYPFFSGPNITKDILCAGNDAVFSFLEDVLTEIIELFPSEYIHIGGDEAPKNRWETCSKCQARIKTQGLKNEHELQSYFIKRIEKFINSKGRKLIGWDEILEGGLAENAAVMSWRGIKGGIQAAQLGHPVVMSPKSHCYFDYTPEKISLEKTYSFDPVPTELNGDQAHLILGGQANMWTHIARTDSAIDRQIFPRLIALSEALWTEPAKKDFKNFHGRLVSHYSCLDKLGVQYGEEGVQRP